MMLCYIFYGVVVERIVVFGSLGFAQKSQLTEGTSLVAAIGCPSFPCPLSFCVPIGRHSPSVLDQCFMAKTQFELIVYDILSFIAGTQFRASQNVFPEKEETNLFSSSSKAQVDQISPYAGQSENRAEMFLIVPKIVCTIHSKSCNFCLVPLCNYLLVRYGILFSKRFFLKGTIPKNNLIPNTGHNDYIDFNNKIVY